MLPTYQALAEEHIRDLHAAAERSRLVAQARRGRPAARQRALARGRAALTSLAGWARRGRFGLASDCATC